MEDRTGSFKALKKTRGGFNAIDLLIILVIIGVIVVFAVSGIIGSDDLGESVKLEYTVAVEGIDADFSSKIKEGELVYDSSTKTLLGTVSSIESGVLYSVYEYDSASNSIVKRKYPDKYNVNVTISADAKFVDGVGYNVEGNRVAVGQQMALRFPECVFKAYCVEMREVQ